MSEALNPISGNFQLFHFLDLVKCRGVLGQFSANANFSNGLGDARSSIELANCFAANFLMPYDRFLQMAQATVHDFNRIATFFDVSFEQACQ